MRVCLSTSLVSWSSLSVSHTYIYTQKHSQRQKAQPATCTHSPDTGVQVSKNWPVTSGVCVLSCVQHMCTCRHQKETSLRLIITTSSAQRIQHTTGRSRLSSACHAPPPLSHTLSLTDPPTHCNDNHSLNHHPRSPTPK